MNRTLSLEHAALARADEVREHADRPSQRRSAAWADSPRGIPATIGCRAAGAPADAAEPHVVGLASTTEDPYQMFDMFGPYTEVVDLAAFDTTLAASPVVEFALNHGRGGGPSMASTRNGTLELAAVKADGAPTGLAYDALVDPTRHDVADMLKALERGDLAEASFKFRIVRGLWSPDFTEYRILEADLDGGDVSACNYGANPSATSGLRELVAASAKSRAVVFSDDDTRARRLR